MATWDRPIPASMRPENQTIYLDPPAQISDAFGGRSWFAEVGVTNIHRVGLLKGLGWTLASEHHTDRINGVQILCATRGLFNMVFGRFERGEDNLDLPTLVIRAAFREKVKATLLKAVYADVLGEHCV